MGGNLNDSILYRGLIIGFDLCDTWGPLARSKFREVRLHRREDVILWGKSILHWCKADAIDYLESNGFAYRLSNWGDLSVPQSSLVLSFDDLDRLDYLEMWSGDFVETVCASPKNIRRCDAVFLPGRAEQAFAADSPVSLYSKLRGRAAEAKR